MDTVAASSPLPTAHTGDEEIASDERTSEELAGEEDREARPAADAVEMERAEEAVPTARRGGVHFPSTSRRAEELLEAAPTEDRENNQDPAHKERYADFITRIGQCRKACIDYYVN